MRKILLSGLFIGSSLFANDGMLLTDILGVPLKEKNQTKINYTKKAPIPIKKAFYNILPYTGLLKYSGTTTKDSGYVVGLYFSDFESPWKTELDIEHSGIKYKDSTPNLNQSDFSIAVNHFKGYNLAYKYGFHYISSSDELTDSGKIFTFEALYYKTLKYNYGVDIYYSHYSNLDTSPTIAQISPKAGFNFGDYYSPIGSFYIEAKFDYIKPLKNKRINNLENVYSSTQITLNNYNGKFTTTLSIWGGKRSFEVANSGFVVNNLSDTQTSGVKISESYKIDTKSSTKFEYSNTNFDENGKAQGKVFLVSYSYNF